MTQELVENLHYYFNDKGLMVLTREYHKMRGYCCGNGCLHCPFDYDCVPEPRRSKLLESRKELPHLKSPVSKQKG